MATADALPVPVSVAPWRPWMWSAGLHAVLVALLAGGMTLSRLSPPTETALALEAVVVDAKTLAALQRQTAPRPVPPPLSTPIPAPAPEPAPDPAPTAETVATPEPAPLPVPRREAVTRPRVSAVAPAVAPSVAVKPPAPAPSRTPPATPATPTATPAPSVPDAAAREAAERDLQAALAEEDRLMALRASGAAAQWGAAIRGRVQRAWIRPDTARSGIDCSVAVTQAPGGVVLAVEVRSCNGDEAVRQSIEDAVRRASPLPAPPDPALFEREIILRFRPDA